jgi:hypothetical protein
MSDVNSMKAGNFTSWTNLSLADRAQVIEIPGFESSEIPG